MESSPAILSALRALQAAPWNKHPITARVLGPPACLAAAARVPGSQRRAEPHPQDKIRELEASKADLQTRLAASEDARGREEEQARLFKRRAQIQLDESVQALAARHEAQLDGARRARARCPVRARGRGLTAGRE